MRALLRPPSALVSALLALACVGVSSCAGTSVPPFVQRSYVRIGASVLGEDLEAGRDDSDGPHGGGEVLFGTLLQMTGTSTDGIEVSFQALSIGGDLDGSHYRYMGGWRRFYRMDRRVRPSVMAGVSWSDIRFQDKDDDFDIRGLGLYGGGAFDYFMTDTLALGAQLRLHLWMSDTDGEHEGVGSVDGGLHLTWRF